MAITTYTYIMATMRSALSVTVDHEGFVLVAGPIDDPRQAGGLFVAKLDRHGELLWRRELPAPESAAWPLETNSGEPAQFSPEEERSDTLRPHAMTAPLAAASPSRRHGWSSWLATVGATAFAALAIFGAHSGPNGWNVGSRTVLDGSLQPLGASLIRSTAAPALNLSAIAETRAELTFGLHIAPDTLAQLTLTRLRQGKNHEAVESAAAYITASPEDALSYLYLGAALQQLGQHEEARLIYRLCSESATNSRRTECRALAGIRS